MSSSAGGGSGGMCAGENYQAGIESVYGTPSAPAGGASTGGNYGGDSSGGVIQIK